MRNTRTWLFGIGAGICGAAIWAAIAYFFQLEVGYVAWGIGGLVGFAIALGSGGNGSLYNSILAVVFTVLAIVVGKYAVLEIQFSQEIAQLELPDTDASPSGEDIVVFLADEIVEAKNAEGEMVQWPAGVDPSEAYSEDEYPKAIWSEASEQWDRMPEEEKERVKLKVATRREVAMAAFYAMVEEEKMRAFKESFGLFDILFFGLAVTTAFRIAGQGGTEA